MPRDLKIPRKTHPLPGPERDDFQHANEREAGGPPHLPVSQCADAMPAAGSSCRSSAETGLVGSEFWIG